MINPAGDAKNVGHRLADGYERAETFKFAVQIQQKIQEQCSNVKVVLTRVPGEEIVPLQNASFSNRLNVDLFISIHMYHEESEKSKVGLFQLAYNKLADIAKRPSSETPVFVPVSKAHQKNFRQSAAFIDSMYQMLSRSDYQKKIDLFQPMSIPLKPLVGISAPAMGIEIGIKEDNMWELCVEPVVEGLKKIIEG